MELIYVPMDQKIVLLPVFLLYSRLYLTLKPNLVLKEDTFLKSDSSITLVLKTVK